MIEIPLKLQFDHLKIGNNLTNCGKNDEPELKKYYRKLFESKIKQLSIHAKNDFRQKVISFSKFQFYS